MPNAADPMAGGEMWWGVVVETVVYSVKRCIDCCGGGNRSKV